MTKPTLAEIAARHYEAIQMIFNEKPHCVACAQPWPCDASILAAMLTPERVLERLAAIEHDQWIEWSRTIASEGLTPERIERWGRYWVPYSELDDATKEHDRKWARLVLAALEPE